MYCIIYTDKLNCRIMEKVRSYKKAIKTLEDLRSSATEAALYREPFHTSTDKTALLSWFGEGSYWDNVSKKDPKVKEKRHL